MAYTTIDDPSVYFQSVLWQGNGSSGRAITLDGNSDLQPDLVWVKDKTDTEAHKLFNTISGATKSVRSQDNSIEATVAEDLQSFDSDGFTVGSNGSVNKSNGDRYVAWCWKAGGSSSTNTDGNLDTTVSANATAGFSIVKYVGEQSGTQTFGHGLNNVPKMILLKKLDTAASDWVVYHEGITSANRLKLNTTDASSSSPNWRATPTSSVFNSNSSNIINTSGHTYLAYVFADVQGFSKMGSYTGNGNADGTFVYLGFKPAWIMTKRTDSADDWQICDNKRDPDNAVFSQLNANSSAAQNDGDAKVDFTSQGFKIRKAGGSWNASGGSFIYMAFAENPFVTGASAIPTTAR